MQSLRVPMTLHEGERRQRQRATSHRTRKTKQHRRSQKDERRQDWRVTGLPPPVGHNAPPVEHRDKVLTFSAWCQVNAFSLATGRRLIKRGDGPPVLQLSPRRIGVKESDNAAWQQSQVRGGGRREGAAAR